MGRGHILGGLAFIAYTAQDHGLVHSAGLARMHDAITAMTHMQHDAHAAWAHNARAALIPTKSAPPKNFT